jgi:hypothetical protein
VEFHYNLDDEVEGKNIRVDFRVVLVLFANLYIGKELFLCFLRTAVFFTLRNQCQDSDVRSGLRRWVEIQWLRICWSTFIVCV